MGDAAAYLRDTLREREAELTRTIQLVADLTAKLAERDAQIAYQSAQLNASRAGDVGRLEALREKDRRQFCEDCDKGIRGGVPCASCGGTGFVLTDIEQGFWTRVQEAEQRIDQLKRIVSQLSGALWAEQQIRLVGELTTVTTRQHDWEFYANGTFCRRCGAQIGSGVPCR